MPRLSRFVPRLSRGRGQDGHSVSPEAACCHGKVESVQRLSRGRGQDGHSVSPEAAICFAGSRQQNWQYAGRKQQDSPIFVEVFFQKKSHFTFS